MTARLPASSPTRGAAVGLPAAERAASGTATAAPDARKFRRVAAVSMRASHATGNRRGVTAIRRDFAALAVHVVRSGPVGQREVGSVLVAPLGRGLEDAVDGHEVFATTRVVRVGVED